MTLKDLKEKCCTMELGAKGVMFCLAIIFFCASAVLMYLGVEMFYYMGNIHGLASNYFLTVPATVSIGLSLLFLVVGITGLLAFTLKDSSCAKRMFFTLLLVIVALEITGAALAVVYKEEVSAGVEQGINKTMKGYDDSENYQKSMDYIQTHLDCCGSHKYQDWYSTPWAETHQNAVPVTCCRENATNCTGSMPEDEFNINHNGCHNELYEDIRSYLVYIIVIAVILFLLQALALSCTCYLVCTRRDKKQYYQQLQTDKYDSSYSGYKA